MRSKQLTICLGIFHMGGGGGAAAAEAARFVGFFFSLFKVVLNWFSFTCVARRNEETKRRACAARITYDIHYMILCLAFRPIWSQNSKEKMSSHTFFGWLWWEQIHKSCKQLFKHTCTFWMLLENGKKFTCSNSATQKKLLCNCHDCSHDGKLWFIVYHGEKNEYNHLIINRMWCGLVLCLESRDFPIKNDPIQCEPKRIEFQIITF